MATKALASDEKMGNCEKCGRRRVLLASWRGRWCGTCLHREERRQNTREMYGRGRRGY